MSKKNKSRPAGPRSPEPSSKPDPALPISSTTPRPAQSAPVRSSGPPVWTWFVTGALLIAALAVGGYFLFFRSAPSNNQAGNNGQAAQIGGVNYCKEVPKFVQNFKLGNNYSSVFSTSERGVKGLALVIQPTAANQGGQTRTFQDPSWTMAGALAPIQYGKSGNFFVSPAPSINVSDNPPDQQNQVYRVDSATGVMSRYLDLPRAGPPSPENPFGVLGMAYDCDTDQLYVSSVAGSSRDQEIGRIYRIDTVKNAVVSQFDKVDALGLTIFNGAKGKRLYYGLARWPEIWSVALDATGNFQGQPRLEISLANLGPRGSDKARAIEFLRGTQMIVHGIEFSFNLIAPTEKQETAYTFKYDPTTDKWAFVGAT